MAKMKKCKNSLEECQEEKNEDSVMGVEYPKYSRILVESSAAKSSIKPKLWFSERMRINPKCLLL
ncbi:hypothetical protein EH222_00855 [candidate division KSB1 bacterium]|nr:MAG: hypothetical protein EH222_00855 [candidate division KSB1 bacterium]